MGTAEAGTRQGDVSRLPGDFLKAMHTGIPLLWTKEETDLQDIPAGQPRWPMPLYLPLLYSQPSSGTSRLQSPLPFLESTTSDRQPGEQQVKAGKGPSALPEGGMGPQLGLVGLPGGWLLHHGGIPLLPQSQLRPA